MDYFVRDNDTQNAKVVSERFGADMELDLTNDGPVTIVMDSKVLKAPKKASSLKVLMPKKKEVKPASFRSAKSIILKPATDVKVKASAKKTIVLKASNSNKKTTVKSKKSK